MHAQEIGGDALVDGHLAVVLAQVCGGVKPCVHAPRAAAQDGQEQHEHQRHGKLRLARQLAAALGTDTERAEAAVRRLQSRYEAEKRGMQITQLEDSWQMATRAEYYENLIRVAATPKKQILTDVVLETLSIIAYKQPITKLEIEKIRGVKSDHAVNKLIEYNLVYEVGRLDVPGRPALFATTEEFLRRFGVGSTKELPEPAPGRIDEFRMEAEEELKFEGKLPEEAEKEMKY